MRKSSTSHPEFDVGWDAAIEAVISYLRLVDWQEDTAADAIEAFFCRPAPTRNEAPARHGWRHLDDESECMEPMWCKRDHYRVRDLFAEAAAKSEEKS